MKNTVSVSRSVDLDAPAIWRVLADFGGISKFNPFLSHSAFIGEQNPATCGVGTRRQCDMKVGGSYLREKVVEWKEGKSYTVHIYESMMPVNNLFTTIGVEEDGKYRSRVYMRATYEPKFGIAGAIVDMLFLRWVMRFMFGRVLKGLEQYSATVA